MRSIMGSWSWKASLATVVIIAASTYAAAQMSDRSEMHARMMQMMQGGMHGGGQHDMMGMHGGMSGQPVLAGQDAFGAIQEVVQILEADPTTDWSKVNIDALRQHLVDM